MKSKLIVILNDNDMSIAPPTGRRTQRVSLAPHLVAARIGRCVGMAFDVADKLPDAVCRRACARPNPTRAAWWTGGTMFEELGFYYVGPIDGHNLDHLIPGVCRTFAILTMKARC